LNSSVRIKVKHARIEMRRVEHKLNEQSSREFNATVNSFIRALKEATPIDTGEARSGWTRRNTLRGALVENDVEHVKQLNEGSSKQAPANFIEKTALRFGRPFGSIVTTK